MSLISDALKKAHVEAAQQDRTRYRDYLNNAGRASVAIPTSHGTMVLAAVLGGCVTAGAGLLFLMRTARTPAPPVPERRVEAVVPKPAVAPAPAVVMPAPAPAEVRVATPAPRQTARVMVVTPPAAPKSRGTFIEGETYASPLAGPLGAELKLSGISSSRGDTVAIINGALVRAGGMVGPFVVEEIEPRRIRVRYVDVRFWVSY